MEKHAFSHFDNEQAFGESLLDLLMHNGQTGILEYSLERQIRSEDMV